MRVNNLTNVFDYIFTQTVNFYIERKNYLENIGMLECVPKNITKQEIHRAYLSSLYSIILELQQNELYIYDAVVLSDEVNNTSLQLFENKIYPQIESSLINKGVKVINNENINH